MKLLLFNLATDADDPVLAFATTWVNALAKYYEQLDVVTMRVGRLTVSENVRVYSVGKEKGHGEARRLVEFYRILGGLLALNRYDACFAHMMPVFAVMAAPALRAYRIPTTLWYSHKSVTPILRLAEMLVDRVVTASMEGFRIPSRKLVVVGHGIDVDAFLPGPKSPASSAPFTILSVGRVAPVKNLELLIESARLLVTHLGRNAFRVRLVGGVHPHDASYAQRLWEQVAEMGLEGEVGFIGPVNYQEIVEEYRHANVVVNLCSAGGMDKVVLEAMSCAVPVVAVNSAFDSVLGQFAPLLRVGGDSPVELACRLTELALMTEEERAELGLQLRVQVVESHNLHRLARRLATEILSNGSTFTWEQCQ